MIPRFSLGGLGRNAPPSFNVMALMHFDGADGSTTFIEETGRRTITVGASAQVDTAQSKFGGASVLFANATQDYLKFDASPDWAVGAEDFTIEFFARKSANGAAGAYRRLFEFQDGDTFSAVSFADNRSTGNLSFSASTNGTSWNVPGANDADAGTWALNVWTHFAIEQLGGVLKLYKDGTAVITVTPGAPLISNGAWQPVIGGQTGVNRTLAGWIDEFRFTRGIAQYQGNFTPPAAPFSL